MHECVGVLGLGVVDDGRVGLVVDLDELGPVLGVVATLGHHERHGVTGETRLTLSEGRARRLRARRTDGRVPLLLGVGVQVGRREHEAHFRARQRRRGVDGPNLRSGEGAANETCMQHPRQRDVVDERPPARQQPGVLDAVDARADIPRGTTGSRVRHSGSPP